MKAYFEFDLPEENEAYQIYNKAIDWQCLVHDIDMFIRQKLKHGDMTDDQYILLDELLHKIHECAKDRNLEL